MTPWTATHQTPLHCLQEFAQTLVYRGFPRGSDGEEFACSVVDLGSIPGLGIENLFKDFEFGIFISILAGWYSQVIVASQKPRENSEPVGISSIHVKEKSSQISTGERGISVNIRRYFGFPGGAVIKNLLVHPGDMGDEVSIPGLEIFPRGGNGNPVFLLEKVPSTISDLAELWWSQWQTVII